MSSRRFDVLSILSARLVLFLLNMCVGTFHLYSSSFIVKGSFRLRLDYILGNFVNKFRPSKTKSGHRILTSGLEPGLMEYSTTSPQVFCQHATTLVVYSRALLQGNIMGFHVFSHDIGVKVYHSNGSMDSTLWAKRCLAPVAVFCQLDLGFFSSILLESRISKIWIISS